jgi:Putative zinc-finger
MNPILQPDIHPDAESLNAFAEQALPQPERAQIVAHLGGCARCRNVVFLAQAAAEADAAPLAEVRTKSNEVRSARPWWKTNWRIALIPAAALTSAAGLLVWVQTKSASPVPTVAQVTFPPPSAMPSMAAPPVPGPSQAAAASVAPPVTAPQVQSKAARAESRNSTLNVNETAETEKTLEPRPPVPQLKPPDGLGAGTNPLSMAQQEAVIAPPAPPAPVPPNRVAVHGSLMAPATAGPRPLSAEAAASRQIEGMPQPVNSLATLRLISHPRLPSGLNAVSSAVILDRILAVDPEGAVFLSRDATKHWERVPIQWTGKAVSVQAPPRKLYPLNAAAQEDPTLHTSPVASVSVMPAPPAPVPATPPSADQSPATPTAGSESPAPGPPPPPADALALPGMLFKLTNDHHQTWVSTDGKVWRQQQGRE